jgi:hypothetical protein
MSFGLCPHTRKTFAQKYDISVHHSLPAPSPVTAEVQFARAQEIEAAYCPEAGRTWPEGSKRYLYFILNDFDNRGMFVAYPCDVRKANFIYHYDPSGFRIYVIDPTDKEEMRFISNHVCDFWRDWSESAKEEWWYPLVMAHDIEHENLPYEMFKINIDPTD